MSLLELVENHTMDIRMASFLWLMAEKKASVIVAAPPRLAGKTTVLMAMLQMTPPWYRVVITKGEQEEFSFLSETDPKNTYILVHEISNHLPIYLWGSRVQTLFQALSRGYSFAATIHSGSAEDIVAQLESDEIAVPKELIANLHVVVNLHMEENAGGVLRRVRRVSFLSRDGDDSGGVSFVNLASWKPEEDVLVYNDSIKAWRVVADRFGMKQEVIEKDLSTREEILGMWLEEGLLSVAQLKEAVTAHYVGRQMS